MSMIRVTDLTFAYPGSYDNMFEHASFQFDTDWKLGFTGRNGRGKTTFLRLLAGELPHGGAIAGEVPCGYFPPPVKDGSRLALEVMAAACPAAEEWELLREAGLLEVDGEALYRPFSTLSNGERTKVLLAALFCGKDRLDGCVDHMMALNKTGVEVVSGAFSSWWENKARKDAFEQTKNDRLRGEIRRLEQSAEELLSSYRPTMLFVEHDGAFRRNIATRVIQL